MKGMGGTIGGAMLAASVPGARAAGEEGEDGLVRYGTEDTTLRLRINGEVREVSAHPGTTLVEVLREQLDLTGTKEACGHGACGSCTVLVDGRPVNSCMMLAHDALDADIVTIEGLGEGGTLHPVQKAFAENDACQCGYCTPGFIMSTQALLAANPDPTLDEIKKGLAGNTCRCGAYPNIFKAVKAVRS
jgi:aerobic-type carbon monoxide dehydrogenase small subunit (CoxS/CutS family)